MTSTHKIKLPSHGTVAYRWSGTGGAAVILLNGSVFNYNQWDLFPLRILRRRLRGKVRFLQYDYLGYGRSSDRTNPIRMTAFADELVVLMNALGIDQAHLFGSSQGSMVGQAMLFRYPKRVRSFCGMGNPCFWVGGIGDSDEWRAEQMVRMEKMEQQFGGLEGEEAAKAMIEHYYLKRFLGRSANGISMELKAQFMRRFAQSALAGLRTDTALALFRYYLGDIQQEADEFEYGLSQVDLPVLLLNGTNDRITTADDALALQKSIPGSQIELLKGVDHMGPYYSYRQARKVFPRYAEFLGRLL